MNKRLNGFSLIELLATLVIVMALAAVALVKYTGTLEKFRAQEGKQTLYTVMGSAMRYKADHGGCASNINQLDIWPMRDPAHFQLPALDPVIVVCPPNILIDRKNGPVYTLKLTASDQKVTCFTGTCPNL